MAIVYEWQLEDVDEYGDIQDLFSFNTREALEIAGKMYPPEYDHYDYCLVRMQGNQAEGLQDRQYAYFDLGGKIPEEFDGGAKVPDKFR